MVNSSKSSIPVLVLCRDLLFTSKIAATARALGVSVTLFRDTAKLEAADAFARRLIVDLGQDGFLEAAARWKDRTGGSVVGFVSHVDELTIARARESGLDQVLPHSAFAARVEQILSDSVKS